jgi:hypothetical protein
MVSSRWVHSGEAIELITRLTRLNKVRASSIWELAIV